MKRVFLNTALTLSITALIIPQAHAEFSDVHDLHSNYEAITYLASAGILDGYVDGTFQPDTAVSRVEFLALVFKGSDIPIDATTVAPFHDINHYEWYEPLVNKAYQEGWIHGYADQTFRPTAQINQAEALKIIGEVQNWSINQGSTYNQWFEPYSLFASYNKYLPTPEFDPGKIMTRAHTSETIYRTLISKDGLSVNPATPDSVLLHPQFAAQAPFGDWSDIRQSEGCEEAVVLMAVKWARGESFTLEEAEQEIINMAEYQIANFGTAHDTSVKDTYSWLIREYFQYQNAKYVENINLQDILDELYNGNLVIIPVNGEKLHNPYFTPPGPLQHVVLVKGYDALTQEFITNEPGTRSGESYRYSASILHEAIHDYETGAFATLPPQEKNMIVISPQ